MTQLAIKLLLVGASVLVAWYAVGHGRPGSGSRLAVRRLLGCAVALTAVLAVWWPDAVTWVANLLGVERGTDLLLYVAVVVFAFVATSLYSRLREVDQQVTTLTRELALRETTAPRTVPRADHRG